MHQGGVHDLQAEAVRHQVRVHLLPQEDRFEGIISPIIIEAVRRTQKEEEEEIHPIHQGKCSVNPCLFIMWVVLTIKSFSNDSHESKFETVSIEVLTKLVSGTSWMPRGTSRGTCTAPSDSCGGGRSASSGTPFDRKISDWVDIPS